LELVKAAVDALQDLNPIISPENLTKYALIFLLHAAANLA